MAFNQKKGFKASNEGRIISKNMFRTFKAYHELCNKFLCEDNTHLLNHACTIKMYMNFAGIKKECVKLHGAKAKMPKL